MPKPSPPPRHQTPRGVEIRHTPGIADRTMRELAPFLAEDGIDLETSELDLEDLQQALNRAVAKRNLALFTPVGRARELAVDVLRRAVDALVERRPNEAVTLLDQAVPESANGSTAEVSSCIGTALRLLDTYLNPVGGTAPAGLRLAPAPHRWPGSSAVDDIVSRAHLGSPSTPWTSSPPHTPDAPFTTAPPPPLRWSSEPGPSDPTSPRPTSSRSTSVRRLRPSVRARPPRESELSIRLIPCTQPTSAAWDARTGARLPCVWVLVCGPDATLREPRVLVTGHPLPICMTRSRALPEKLDR
jgi:hypothetical protein